MGSYLPISSPSLLWNELRFAPAAPFSVAHRRSRRLAPSSLGYSSRFKPIACWVDSDGRKNDGFGDWFVPRREMGNQTDWLRVLLVRVGSSAAAILLVALTYCCWSKKGFRSFFAAPLIFVEKLKPAEPENHEDKQDEPTSLEIDQVLEKQLKEKADTATDVLSPTEDQCAGGRKQILPVALDPSQEEALSVLKKLKIIEDDAIGNELCTRREYARWLVKANSRLERNPKQRIVPQMLLVGLFWEAFDDVNLDDPDFWSIQSLAEVGIVCSKLSAVDTCTHSEDGSSSNQEKINFYPDSSISRIDLVIWKIMLEYPFSLGLDDKISKTKINLLDLNGPVDALPQLYKDLMANDRSIIRRTFGNIRRLQPQKFVTKAQAAVLLSSGRMEELIHSELSRLQAEELSRLAEMEEIRAELNRRGDIQRFWEEKLTKERDREYEAEKDLKAALLDLEEEKVAQNESLLYYVKEKAAIDCQQQLLYNLKEEVDGMYDKLRSESANFMAEKQEIEKLSADFFSKQDAIVKAKSILEAEKEALRILRYWVSEEALQLQFRAKSLEQAIKRWQYHGEFGVTPQFLVGGEKANLSREPEEKQL